MLRTRRRPAVLLVLVITLSVLGGLTQGNPLKAAEQASELKTDPVLEGRSLFDSPRTVNVGTDARVGLYDNWGRELPLTGPERQGRTLYLPGLIPGYYELRSEDGHAVRFEISSHSSVGEKVYAMPDPVGSGGRRLPPILILLVGGAGLMFAGALTATRRRKLGALVAVAALAGGFTLSATAQADEAPGFDDCLVLSNGDAHVPEYGKCALARMASTLHRQGILAAMSEVEAAAIPPCHEVIHGFAQLAWFEVGRNELLQPGLGTCGGAFYHGVLYSASLFLDDEAFVQIVTGLCETAEPDENARGACYHGVGHGLAVRFGTDTERVISTCRQIAIGRPLNLMECVGAAYMQHSVRWAKAGGEPGFLPEPPVPVASFCEKTEPSELLSMCYLAMTMAETAKREVPMVDLLARCNALPPERSTYCADGTARDTPSHYPKGGADGAQACVESLEREADADQCIRTYSYFVYQLNREKSMLTAICRAVQRPESLCLGHPDLWRSKNQPASG